VGGVKVEPLLLVMAVPDGLATVGAGLPVNFGGVVVMSDRALFAGVRLAVVAAVELCVAVRAPLGFG
tara:strand:+ start:910 stop:1110 length:201 start_codon:yes stop_codon:yes gene_type:complete